MVVSVATGPSETLSLHWGGWYCCTFGTVVPGSRNPTSPGALRPQPQKHQLGHFRGVPHPHPQAKTSENALFIDSDHVATKYGCALIARSSYHWFSV